MATIVEEQGVAAGLIDDEPLFEIIDGQRVELPPMSAYAGRIASRLVSKINEFAEPRGLGEAVMEVLFHLPAPVDRNRRPDVAFVSSQRWPKGKPQPKKANAWEVVPNLAAEVISPHDLADDTLARINELFLAGVQLVWVLYPRLSLVHVYESFTAIRVLTRNDFLDGGPVLPGFRQPIEALFPDDPEPLSNSSD